MTFKRSLSTAALSLALAASAAAPVLAQSVTSRPQYGCFKVTAAEMNIHGTAFASGPVIGTAKRGEILVKRKRFCTARGFWCAVTTRKGVQGYGDKSLMAIAPCPAKLSTAAN
jgi:hypothetical protein